MRLFTRPRYFDDDFDWDIYTRKYRKQLEAMSHKHDFWIPKNTARFNPATKKLEPKGVRLHHNWRVLYEIISVLGVNSVHEVGCGAGYHLHNLARLYPHLKISGGDRSTGQLDLLRERTPQVADRVMIQDITMPLSRLWPRAELVYTQAVIMHIHTAVSHLVGLANMLNLAERYVVLMESYRSHHFVNDIRRLGERGHLNWDAVNFHAYPFEDRPYCLVVAREPCDLPPLTDYAALMAR